MPKWLGRPLSHLYLLLIALLGWVLFKYTDLGQAAAVFRGLAGANGNALTDFQSVITGKNNLWLLCFAAFSATPVWSLLLERLRRLSRGEGFLPGACRVFLYGLLPSALLLLSTAGLVGNSYNPFLYFKF